MFASSIASSCTSTGGSWSAGNAISPTFVTVTTGVTAGFIIGPIATVTTTVQFNAPDVGKPQAVFITGWVPSGSVSTLGISQPGNTTSISPSMKALATSSQMPLATTTTTMGSYVLVQKTSTGWQAVVNGQLLPYVSNVTSAQSSAITLLNNTSTANLPGAQFCVGYGTSAAEMTAAGRMQVIGTVPDPNATNTATGGCVIHLGSRTDFDGDGKNDILWFNASTGQTAAWLMNGTSMSSGAILLTDPNWKGTGTGDLNGDGKSDILWYNASTGQTAAWLMNGTSMSSGAILLTDPNWKVAGTGDLNGDGKTDILWYNASTGQTAAWLMNGTSMLSGAILLTDPNWKVAGTGDFNGDGKTDILWYNASTGQTAAWLMNGTSMSSGAILLTDPNWKGTGTGDFDGDGKSDILWYNASTGQTAAWLMNGTSMSSGAILLTDPNWKATGTGDLNGDGKSDILWFNASTGQTAAWLMNGTSRSSGAILLTDPKWKVTGY
jgi:hypothetical protein